MASRGTLDVAGCIHFSREELEGATTKSRIKRVKNCSHSSLTQNCESLPSYYNSPSLKALVYEYLPNGTLEDALETGLEGRSKEGKAKISGIHLPWMCRISIATDTARGLAYLHTADTVPLVHRDVKSANVLLDLAFRAKVGDFGLARVFQESDSTSTSRVVGTSGYIPPEYYHGRITTKMDTYSFGVVTYMEQDMDKGQVYNKLEALMTLSAQEYAAFTKKSERERL
ncbi:hypothetical protein EMCRGX_G021386 [Ephydatia muelleri]